MLVILKNQGNKTVQEELMILELDKSSFRKCRNLLNENGQLEAKAVVEGVNPVRIFVDDALSPTTGMIWLGNNDGFTFFGNENNEAFNNELNEFIDKVIFPEAKKVNLKWFECIGNHEKWNQTLERVFQHRQLGSWNQKVYTLLAEDYQADREPLLEKDYEVTKITNNLLSNQNSIRNIDFLESKILEFWNSITDFFDAGNGYCVLYNNEIVSVCFSGFVVENVHCINIETVKVHQGKNLAKKIAHCFVKDCLDKNFVPYWDCMEMNKPSIAVAESIGLKNIFNYVGYEFSLT